MKKKLVLVLSLMIMFVVAGLVCETASASPNKGPQMSSSSHHRQHRRRHMRRRRARHRRHSMKMKM